MLNQEDEKAEIEHEAIHGPRRAVSLVSWVELVLQNLAGALRLLREQIRGSGNACRHDLIPGALCLVAEAIRLFQQFGNAGHVRHSPGEEWTGRKPLAISHTRSPIGQYAANRGASL